MELRTDNHIVHWEEIAAVQARTIPFPNDLDVRLCHALRKRGVSELYTHQAEALKLARAKKNFVAVTPTASGKTMCYNLPVVEQIMAEPTSRALYIFPTKALAQDQMSEIHELIDELGIDLKCHTYDGDTAPQIRTTVRKAGHIVITNLICFIRPFFPITRNGFHSLRIYAMLSLTNCIHIEVCLVVTSLMS